MVSLSFDAERRGGSAALVNVVSALDVTSSEISGMCLQRGI